MQRSSGGYPTNPRADLPCGARDQAAPFPEPQHHGCKRCAEIIKEILIARKPPKPTTKPARQTRLGIMDDDFEQE